MHEKPKLKKHTTKKTAKYDQSGKKRKTKKWQKFQDTKKRQQKNGNIWDLKKNGTQKNGKNKIRPEGPKKTGKKNGKKTTIESH